MFFKRSRSGIVQNFTMDVDPAYNYIEFLGVQRFMMESKVFISSTNFKLKSENGNLVSFNGQNITFRISINEV